MINLMAMLFAPTTGAHHLWQVLFLSLSFVAFGLVSHVLTRSYKDDTGTTLSKAETITGNAELIFDQAVPIAANTNYVIKLVRTQLKTLMITCDQAVTIYTNAAGTGSPTDTITLLAGQMMVWDLATDTLSVGLGLVKCPITADITAGIWVTNASSAVAALKIRAVLAT